MFADTTTGAVFVRAPLPLELILYRRLERKSGGGASEQNTMSVGASARFRDFSSSVCVHVTVVRSSQYQIYSTIFFDNGIGIQLYHSDLYNILKPRRGHRTPIRIYVYLHNTQFAMCNFIQYNRRVHRNPVRMQVYMYKPSS